MIDLEDKVFWKLTILKPDTTLETFNKTRISRLKIINITNVHSIMYWAIIHRIYTTLVTWQFYSAISLNGGY